jgi:hypothetical protein
MSVLQGRTRRWLLLLTVCATAAACNDSVAPRQFKTPAPSNIIVDGAHNGGNDDVFFLPPLVADPSGAQGYGDPFQSGLPVEIKLVCTAHITGSLCPDIDYPPSVVKSTSDEQYMVNWDTKLAGVDPGDTYRINVIVGTKTIAWADVFLVPNGNPKNIATQGDIPLADGRTMPIKVRIEKGWNCSDRTSKKCSTQIVGNTPIGSPITVIAPQNTAAGQFEGNWIPFCTSTPAPGCVPQGTQVVVTVEDQSALLNQVPANGGPAPTCSLLNDGVPKTHMISDQHCVKFTTDPAFKFASPVKVAVCVHSDELTQQLIKYDVNETPRFLQNVPFKVNGVDFTALCEQGETQIGSRSSSRVLNSALALLSKFGHAVEGLVVPKSAYAFHNGVGGFIGAGDGFSYVAPGRPLTLSSSSGDLQSGIVGTALASPVQVKVSTVHQQFDFESGFPNPLNNLPIQCSIDNGSGSFPGNFDAGPPPTQVTVFTDLNGIATCPSWILGAVGTNTLHVTAPNIDNGIIAVEDAQSETGGVVPTQVVLNNTAVFTAQGQQLGLSTPVGPQSGSVFNIFPRTTNLSWTTAPAATSYDVELAYCNGGQYDVQSRTPDYGCTNWVTYPLVSVPGTTYTFDFVGAQPGRWRVRPVAGNVAGVWSDYSYFLYLQ